MEHLPVKPERFAELQDYARRRGTTTVEALDDALGTYLAWEREDYRETVAAVRRGSEELQAGQGRPAGEFVADLRRKHGLSN